MMAHIENVLLVKLMKMLYKTRVNSKLIKTFFLMKVQNKSSFLKEKNAFFLLSFMIIQSHNTNIFNLQAEHNVRNKIIRFVEFKSEESLKFHQNDCNVV